MSTTNEPQEPNDNSQEPNEKPTHETPPDDSTPSELELLRAQLKQEKKKAREWEKQLEAERIQKLTNEKNWEEIAKLQQTRADEAEGKLSTFSHALVQEKKLSAIRDAAVKAKIKPSMLDLLERLDFDDVIVEHTSTGRIQILNADKAVERVKLKHPDMFGGSQVSVNANSPETHPPTGQVTYQQVKAAQELWAKTRSKEDQAKYQDVLLKFKAQG